MIMIGTARHHALTGAVIAIGMVLAAWMQVGVSVTVNNPTLISNGTTSEPYLIRLRREVYPVRRQAKIVAFKASYSGVIHVGFPQSQEFRVVFDTGSGHVVLPSIACITETCRKHRRYNMANSATSQAINLDGSRLRPGFLPDQVTIGFGTGKVTGEFVQEHVCLGPAPLERGGSSDSNLTGPCVQAQIVMAVDMSKRPFELFDFDGILGLGLRSLALSDNFSLFHLLAGRSLAIPHFGVYLTDADGEESEIAVGGHNPLRLLEPLSWVPMARPELGYWQVDILGVYVDGVRLALCNGASTCTGILDTGTSHLGVPSASNDQLASLLTRPSQGATDCRLVVAPVVELELRGFNLTLSPKNYMRQLPLAEDIDMDFPVTDREAALPPVADRIRAGGADSPPASNSSSEKSNASREDQCTPKLMPVNLTASIGQNVFILGEPVLHRYYTVYDWGGLRAGFGLAAHARGPGGGSSGGTTPPAAEANAPLEFHA